MKGIVFTEFLEMVDNSFSMEMTEKIIEAADLPSKGAYSSVGTYNHEELLLLAQHLSRLTKTPLPDLMRAFGRQLLERFAQKFPHFFEGETSSLDFLEKVESYIHIEVRKLYPDAELPYFEHERKGPGTLVMVYRSSRHLADLAEGLILGCLNHFGEIADVSREDLTDKKNYVTRFTITKK